MTKYKLNNAARTASEVTLTSYMTGSTDSNNVNMNMNMMRKDDKQYTIPEIDSNQNSKGIGIIGLGQSVKNTDAVKSCHVCPHSCEFLQQSSRLAASLAKGGGFEAGSRFEAASLAKGDGFGVNELRGERLDVCLCERYNGGCKLCPLPPGAPPTWPGAAPGALRPVYHQPCKGRLTHDTASSGSLGGWRGLAARRMRGCCSAKALARRLPVCSWLPQYSPRAALADLIAGVTVGLTVIPQAIAYAGVAGLPPQYGLYSSFMACFVYAVFGSVKDSAIGPTAIAAILTRENLHGLGPEFAVLLAFLSGCVELLMGILQLGFLIDFISGPVSVGFTSAAAIIIATTQVKDILGLSFPGGKFLQVWSGMYEHIGETRLWDSVLGVTCIAVLLLLRKVKDIKVGIVGGDDVELAVSASSESDAAPAPPVSRCSGFVSQALWFLSTTRNISVVLAAAAVAYYCESIQKQPFRLTGEVKPGLPEFSLPPFSATVGNHTYSFSEMTATLGSAIFVVPLLSILENIALAKVFSEGRVVDATQEMVALGVCNMASSLVQAMPVSGALSRGAVNHAAGVRTPAGGIYTGALVLLSLQYLTPYFHYIPKAALAGVIIAAVIFMMELHVFKPIWRTRKLDVIPAAVTFLACLLSRLELGIVVGIAINLIFLLYASARPTVHVSHECTSDGLPYTVAVVDRSLAFPSAEYVRRALRKAALQHKDAPLVIDATHVHTADFTAAKGIKSLCEDFAGGSQPLIFYNVRPKVANALRGVKVRFLYARSPIELEQIIREGQAGGEGGAGSGGPGGDSLAEVQVQPNGKLSSSHPWVYESHGHD